MARAGRLVRQAQRDAALPPCECGHSQFDHRELPYELLSVVDGAVVAEPNPEYRVCHFHCAHCSCVRTPTHGGK